MDDGYPCKIKEEWTEEETEENIKTEHDTPSVCDPHENEGESSSSNHSGSPNVVEEMAVFPECVYKGKSDDEGEAEEFPIDSVGSYVEGSNVPKANDITSEQVKKTRSSRNKNIMSCVFCEYTCSRACDLKRHVRKHTGERPYGCNLCDYATTRSSHLKLHMRIHSGEKPYKCDICDYATGDGSHLKVHKKTHSEVKPFTCEICGGAFKRARDLNVHVQRVHLGERPYACQYCDFASKLSSNLKNHIKRCHTESLLEPEVVLVKQESSDDISAAVSEDCKDKCGDEIDPESSDAELAERVDGSRESTVSEGDDSSAATVIDSESVPFKKTRLTTSTEKALYCEFCAYSCTRPSDLKIHMRSHTGERPFGCHLCPYSGTRASHLKIHMRTHTGEKPYKCNVCDYASSDSGHLKAHKKIHSEDRPHACEVCGLAFKRTHDLTVHKRIHTGERPHACDFCNFASNRPSHLKTHIKRHHPHAILEPELQISEDAQYVQIDSNSQS